MCRQRAFAVMVFFLGIALMPTSSFCATTIKDHLPHLRDAIAANNLEAHKKSLSRKSYRGHEGILGVDPEKGKTLGLKVFINDAYLKAKKMYEEALTLFEEAEDAMRSREEETFSGEHEQKVLKKAIQYNALMAGAWEQIALYQKELSPENDDRLNKAVCLEVMEDLIQKHLEKASYNLRDALGRLYNQCRGNRHAASLNLDNIKFVNQVYNQFLNTTAPEAGDFFDLDILTIFPMTTSAPRTASATGLTARPALLAFASDAEPGRRPTMTSTPESLRLLAWACP